MTLAEDEGAEDKLIKSLVGEAVKAVVQVVDGVDAGSELEAALLEHCRGELATYKCPRSVDFTSELPRSDAGKVQRRLVRQRYWQGLGREL